MKISWSFATLALVAVVVQTLGGDVGAPVADTETKRVWLELTYFYGLGALIVFLGAIALGRLSVRSARDIAYAERDVAAYEPPPVAASAQRQPAPSDEVTEIQPVGTATADRPRRSWRDMFSGGSRRPAHR